MNVLITGAKGFAGRNLAENLKCIRDGKNLTRPKIKIDKIFEYDLDSTPEELENYCAYTDFIFHFAGVNRPKDPADFQKGNFGFTSTLLETLKKYKNKAPVMISSSVQATLSGRFGDSEYGRSKLAGEELIFNYGIETGTKVYVYRFPNLVGKWVRPNYNSAVGTFCYNIANDLPIKINDPNVELEMLFIDDLLEELYDCIEDRPHRCEYEGIAAIPKDNGRYCYSPVTYKATLAEIVNLLKTFHDQPQNLVMPAMPEKSLTKKLFSMYLSYLPKDKIAYRLKTNFDSRGSFTELLKTLEHGQISINISKPGITKGQHWHNSKWEIFWVVAGHGLIQEKKIGSDEVLEFEVSGENIQAVYMLPGYTHNIINLSETENLVTVMWANEIFNNNFPDTFREEIQSRPEK